MCTATTYRSQDFYFGRTFDYEFNYGEEVTVTPRNYPFPLRHQNALTEHYAMIGIAHMAGDYPLYYDAVNEKGLGMAGLNFPGMQYTAKCRQVRTTSPSLSLSPGFWGSVPMCRKPEYCYPISIWWIRPLMKNIRFLHCTGFWQTRKRPLRSSLCRRD